MNLSAILVIVPPGDLEGAVARLGELPGVDVHHTDPSTGRIIVTQEAPSIPEEVEGLKRIRALPVVVLAEMVEHHFEHDGEIIDAVPRDLQDGLHVPAFLRDEFTRDS